MMTSPSGTASAPPGTKSFWRSTRIRAFIGFRFKGASTLRRRQLGDEAGELLGGRALGVADVVAARRHPRAEAFLQAEAQHPAEAEAGVEVVAGAGADLRLLHERAGELGALARDGCGGAAARVDDD